MQTYEFDALIKKHSGINAAYVEFPYDVEKAFGTRGRVPVQVLFDGKEYRGSLVKMGGDCHWIGITQKLREMIGKEPGETVHVILRRDTETRQMIVPADLKTKFEEDRAAHDFFTGLSYTHQKEYIQWITGAKKAETRARRLTKTLEMLNKKIKHP